MKKKFNCFIVASFLIVLLSGCLPGVGTVILAPEFRVHPEGLRVVRFAPPIISSGVLVLRLPIDVYNPNAASLSISSIDFDFFVNDNFALNSNFSRSFAIPSEDTKTLVLDIEIPLGLGGALFVQDLIGLANGDYTTFRLDGKVTVKILNVIEVFAKTTLLRGSVN